jgi:hypothetical protein
VAIFYLAFLVRAMNHWTYASWMLLVLVPALFAAGLAIVRRVVRTDPDPMVGVFALALAGKLAASFARYFVAFELYGSGDAAKYHLDAVARLNDYYAGRLSFFRLITPHLGTESITDLTSTLYAAMGPTRLGGFVVFSWFGFWGLFMFTRALRIGLPEADHRRYTWLVMFLPSLVFWPSSIGKEAVMMFALGLCAYGAAKICRRIAGGWPVLAVGLLVGGIVRPHVSAVVLTSLIVAMLFRRHHLTAQSFGLGGRFVGLIVLTLGLAFAFGQTVKYLVPKNAGTTSNVEAVGKVFDKATSGTASGDSEIDRPLPNNPLDYPGAAFTVLFRPTILEARNGQNFAAGAETTLLLAVAIASRKRLKRLPTVVFRRPFVLFCVIYTGIFCFAWSAFANLGAIARQRVQVWPFMLVLLCLPAGSLRGADRGPARASQPIALRSG